MEWLSGIDTIAHKSTLEARGNTIAVLPCGFNNIFPLQNVELFKEILQNRGLIISEYPPNEPANSSRFLERNRIVSGLALGVLVIEAKYRSGTSVTAKLAREQGKEVFAVPHEIGDINGVGTNRLIKEGANLVTNVKDIIDKLQELVYCEYHNEISENEEFINNINEKREREIANKDYQELYKIIGDQIYNVDEICKNTTKNIVEVQQILLMMEIEGYVKKVGGGYKCI